jgi:hypothetical protein
VGQLAGFSGAVLALAGANADSVLGALHGAARDLAGGSLLIGFFLLVLALVTVLRGALLPGSTIAFSAKEVANYLTDRFIREPDLWRVHLRTISSLQDAIETAMRQGDEVERSVGKAEYFFVSGLFTVGIAFATLIAVVTF